jgi:membrane-bound lytic murein transglycosylase D
MMSMMMKFRNFFLVIILTLLVSSTSFIAMAERRDSVTIITITDLNQIPKNAVIQRLPPKPKVDSSRFVQRLLVDNSEKPANYASFNVNKSIYGSYTDYILEYVKSYHENHGEHIAKIKARNKGYFSLIDNVMKRYGLPKELKSLAIIESAMNCNAISPVGAVGPWQFMPGTAKDLGLRVDNRVDERRDFYKSTNAAARYLKYLHNIFHDWFLVIASYNCGPAPVLRAINSGNGHSFWDIKPRLPKETQNHVMAFIATSSFLDKVFNVLGLGDIPKGAKVPKADFTPLRSVNAGKTENDLAVSDNNEKDKQVFSAEELDKMAILKVKGSYTINAIARILDEDPVRLKRWNPGFDAEVASALTPIHLRIPITKLEQFIILKDKIMNESKKVY